MSTENKPVKQHWVPRSYLRCFRDPASTQKKPFIWYFEKDKAFKSPVRQSPYKIFYEKDLYTIETIEGEKLYEIETDYYAKQIDVLYPPLIRKIERREPLSNEEHSNLCTFIAAQMLRTPRMQETVIGVINQVADLGEKIAAQHGKESDEVKKLRQQAKNIHTLNTIELIPEIAEVLHSMNVAFICAPKLGRRFITSDNPVFLHNPDLRWQRFHSPGLRQRNVELYFPASPTTLVAFNWNNYRGYVHVSNSQVGEMNRWIQGHAVRWMVASSKKTKLYWFSRFPADPLFLLKIFKYRVSLLLVRLKRWYAYRK